MDQKNDIKIEEDSIRRQWDEKSKKWYFSIVDVVSLISDTSDARNYWKVLKSRLNKNNKELVTKCNQLKLTSNDGKSYLTDTADSETILEIINTINPSYLKELKRYFENLEETYPHAKESFLKEIENLEDIELPINMYHTSDSIFIEALVAGSSQDDILISANYKNISISGKRILPENKDAYKMQEIYWGAFSRNLSLPYEIELDKVEATISRGLLIIKMQKIDTLRNKNIKVKPL